MPQTKSAPTLPRLATLLSRLTLIATLIAIFTTVFNSTALPAMTPAGAEFSATARQHSVASHYRAKTDGYHASVAAWSRAAFHY